MSHEHYHGYRLGAQVSPETGQYRYSIYKALPLTHLHSDFDYGDSAAALAAARAVIDAKKAGKQKETLQG